MQFGRTNNPATVNFHFPEDDTNNLTVLGGKPHPQPQVYIGCPVWTDRGYVGNVYPKGAKPADYLHYYSRQFSAIELNATHYRPPGLSTMAKWRDATPEHFRFSPKFPQQVSHRRNPLERVDVLDSFLEQVMVLEDRLGMSFIQMPPYYKPAYLPLLARFLESLPHDLPVAVEVRHHEWFESIGAQNELFALLKELGKTAIITDTANRRDVLHQRLTTKTAFVRFNGHNLHPTDHQRLDDWAERIGQWLSQGLETLYFYMHQPDKSLNAQTVGYFVKQLNSKAGLKLKAPKLQNEDQQQLF